MNVIIFNSLIEVKVESNGMASRRFSFVMDNSCTKYRSYFQCHISYIQFTMKSTNDWLISAYLCINIISTICTRCDKTVPSLVARFICCMITEYN
jgi:hypothetical protein